MAWVLTGIVATSFAAYTGEYWDLMSQAVNSVDDFGDGVTHNEMVWSFIAMSVVVWLFGVLIGGALVWMTNTGKLWAKYTLTLFCIYQIWIQIDTAIVLNNNYEIPIGIDDWLVGIVSLLLMLYVGAAPHLSSNKYRKQES
jgi:hypothetical protein